MLFVQVCVGSSCHLKGSQDIVELLEKAVEEHHVDDEVVLSGSFCIGKCNRVGVTVQVNDDVHVGVTRENFAEFFKKNIEMYETVYKYIIQLSDEIYDFFDINTKLPEIINIDSNKSKEEVKLQLQEEINKIFN